MMSVHVGITCAQVSDTPTKRIDWWADVPTWSIRLYQLCLYRGSRELCQYHNQSDRWIIQLCRSFVLYQPNTKSESSSHDRRTDNSYRTISCGYWLWSWSSTRVLLHLPLRESWFSIDWCWLIVSVAITGYRVPPPEMATMAKYRELMVNRIPYFNAWGVFSLVGDVSICGTSGSNQSFRLVKSWSTVIYYLLRIKDSIIHRQKRLIFKLQALVLETMWVVTVEVMCW